MSILTPIYGFIKSQIGDNIGKTIDEDLPANWDKVETLINDLDNIKADVETGVWTPTINGQIADPTISYVVQDGTFVKIGKLINIAFFIRTTLTGGDGRVLISGLPLARKSPRIQGVGYASIGSTQKGILRIGSLVSAGNLTLNLVDNANFLLSEINNGSTCDISGSITYEF